MSTFMKYFGLISSTASGDINSDAKVFFNPKSAFWQFAVRTKQWGYISLRVPSKAIIMGGKWTDWLFMCSANGTLHTATYIATNAAPVKDIIVCAERKKFFFGHNLNHKDLEAVNAPAFIFMLYDACWEVPTTVPHKTFNRNMSRRLINEYHDADPSVAYLYILNNMTYDAASTLLNILPSMDEVIIKDTTTAIIRSLNELRYAFREKLYTTAIYKLSVISKRAIKKRYKPPVDDTKHAEEVTMHNDVNGSLFCVGLLLTVILLFYTDVTDTFNAAWLYVTKFVGK